jgi:hypothetical protein
MLFDYKSFGKYYSEDFKSLFKNNFINVFFYINFDDKVQ